MIRQAIVTAGGRGTRLGALARQYGNKALVPVAGAPILLHTIRDLKEAGVRSIIVTVNYVAEFRAIARLLEGDPAVAVVGNLSRQTSAQALPILEGLLDARFLFVYGHAPVPPDHLREMVGLRRKGIVASLYSSTSQKISTRKPAYLEPDGRVRFDLPGNLFLEPPHLLDHSILAPLRSTQSWKQTFLQSEQPVYGIRASHPPEYHTEADLRQVRTWLKKHLKSRASLPPR